MFSICPIKSIWERPISANPLFVEKQLSVLEIVTTKRLHFGTKSANLAQAVTLSMLVIGRWRRDCIFCLGRHLAIVTSCEFNSLMLFQPDIVPNFKWQFNIVGTERAKRILLISWNLFLAVHNSSLGDLVTESLTDWLSDLLILEHKTIKEWT